MNKTIKIQWYRSKIDKGVMSELMKTSDFRGFCQVIPQFGLFAATSAVTYLAFLNVHPSNWTWSVPVLLAALFVHGTFSSFLGSTGPVHELVHKTPFRTKAWNEFFLKVYSFLSWSDCIAFRPSHVKHHQMTVHDDYDGEVVLPMKLDWYAVKFWLSVIFFNPIGIWKSISHIVRNAIGGKISFLANDKWHSQCVPESNSALRIEHRNWARTVLLGQLALAILFIATGHWFLVIIVNLGAMYAKWLTMLCGTTQHIGMSPNVSDFRLCCRTFTCHWLPAFLYWNMQYHVEHHMFPAVPFYNLPKLRKAIEHDLPPAPHGLVATWKEILPIIRRQAKDPSYVFVPVLPKGGVGEAACDETLEREAAALAPV